MIHHTRKEKELIRDAWNDLEYLASIYSQGARLSWAETTERKERGCLHTARALILRETLRVYNENPPMLDAAHTTTGIIIGSIAGAETFRRANVYKDRPEWSTKVLTGLPLRIEAASQAHETAVNRAVDKPIEHAA